MRNHTITFRVSQDTLDWLQLNTSDMSSYVRKLITEAREREEARPLDERVTETSKWLTEQEKSLDSALIVANRSSNEESEASIRYYNKSIKRLKAKLEALKKS